MAHRKLALKFECKNPACNGYSKEVLRRFDICNEFTCSKCGQVLGRITRKLAIKQDLKAKLELNQLSLT